jgi:hypothetical protein
VNSPIDDVGSTTNQRLNLMNPYLLIGSASGTPEAASLSQRLAAWHDTMVAHERRLRAGRLGDECDDDCAHGQARALWAEAVTTFGDRAQELSFLRSRAIGAIPPSEDGTVSAGAEPGHAADGGRENQRTRRSSAPGQRPLRADAPPTSEKRAGEYRA